MDIETHHIDEEKKYSNILRLATNSGPFCPEHFTPSAEILEDLASTKVLVVGAGGLGCEILKDLALAGFKQIHVIDLDTVDVSNLNRQLLFRKVDIGRYKAQCAAEFIMHRCPDVKVHPYTKPIQDYDNEFYSQFGIIIAGLDNIEARQWLNAMVCSLVEFDSDDNITPTTIIPLIDAGTEGFSGHCRIILPYLTPCYECTISMLPAQVAFQGCTIASVPRIPEHCIAFALEKMWPTLTYFEDHKSFSMDHSSLNDSEEKLSSKIHLDKDNPEHMTWLYERALERAEGFGITGVTYSLTQQVVKNIIPAIASQNALISAMAVQEAFKIRSAISMSLDNWIQYYGGEGVNTSTFSMAKDDDCMICGERPFSIHLNKHSTLLDLINSLNTCELAIKKPSISYSNKPLYISGFLSTNYEQNLSKKLIDIDKSFFLSNQEVTVTDSSLGNRVKRIKILLDD